MSNEMYNEKNHAYIVGLFYKHLKASPGGAGIRVFIKATQRYAEQRGNRMALRALRDGQKLNFASYAAYGEWTGTVHMDVTEERSNDRLIVTVSTCPWAETFAEMGLKDCGMVYCGEIDLGIVRGFNPYLDFELKSVLHNSEHCIQVFKNIDNAEKVPAPADGKKDWQYHCAHIFETMAGISKAAGYADVVDRVKADYILKFGEAALEGITGTDIDFNLP
jgi:hypothetical protein